MNEDKLKKRVNELIEKVDFKKADFIHMHSFFCGGDTKEDIYTVRFGNDELVLTRSRNIWRDPYAYVKKFNGKDYWRAWPNELRVPVAVVDELDTIMEERAKWKDDSLLRGLARLAKA